MRPIAYSAEVLRASGPSRKDPGLIADGQGDAGAPDGYAAKLVKYVPAETVAFVAFISTASLTLFWSWIVLVASAIGSAIYMSVRAPQPWFTSFLSFIAGPLWVIGTTNLGERVFDLPYTTSKVIFGIAVFLLPGIDEMLTGFYKRRLAR